MYVVSSIITITYSLLLTIGRSMSLGHQLYCINILFVNMVSYSVYSVDSSCGMTYMYQCL